MGLLRLQTSPGARTFYDQHRAAGDCTTKPYALWATASSASCTAAYATHPYDEHTAWAHRNLRIGCLTTYNLGCRGINETALSRATRHGRSRGGDRVGPGRRGAPTGRRSVHQHRQLERVPRRPRWYRQLAAGGCPPQYPSLPYPVGPALRERLTPVASYDPAPPRRLTASVVAASSSTAQPPGRLGKGEGRCIECDCQTCGEPRK